MRDFRISRGAVSTSMLLVANRAFCPKAWRLFQCGTAAAVVSASKSAGRDTNCCDHSGSKRCTGLVAALHLRYRKRETGVASVQFQVDVQTWAVR